MKILIPTQYFHPETFKISEVAKELHQRGHQVQVLTGQPNYPVGDFYPGYSAFFPSGEDWEGVSIKRVPLYPRGRGRRWELALNYLSFVVSMILFGIPRLGFKRYDYSLIYLTSPVTSSLPAIVYKWLTGTPVAIWVQDLWPESVTAVGAVKKAWMLKPIEWLVSFIYKQSDVIFVQSEGFIDAVVARGADPRKVRFVPNWAEDFYFEPAKGKDSRFSDSKVNLVFAGNLGAAQDLENLVAAIKKLPQESPAHVIFIGDGRFKTKIQSMAKELVASGRVEFWDPVSPSQVVPLLQSSDGLLVTLRDEPIFRATVPNKVQTGLATGRPLLASLDGEAAQLIKRSEAGYVCPPGDPIAFAKTIQSFVMLNAQEREAMGQRGHAFAQANYRQSKVIDRLEAIFNEFKI